MLKYKSVKNLSIIISNFYPVYGGAEKQMYLVGTGLVKKGYNVTVITRMNDRSLDKVTYLDGIKVVRVDSGKNKWSKFIFIFKSLLILLKMERQNTIISSQYGANMVIGYIYSLFRNCKVVVRGSGREIEMIKSKILKEIRFNYLCNKADYIIAINKRLEGFLHSSIYKDKNRKKIRCISNAVKVGIKVNMSENKYVLCTSRIEHIKGIDLLLESWSHIERKGYNIPLLIVGDGSLKEKLSKEYSYLKSVRWENEYNNVDHYLNNAKMTILTSRYEGISNSLLESMARGIPVIATNISGNREIIKHNITGVLVDLDPIEIANNVINLYNDDDKLNDISSSSYEYIKQHRNISNFINEYLKIVER